MASLSQGRTAAAQCGLFTYKSVPVIFEPPCMSFFLFLVLDLFCLFILFDFAYLYWFCAVFVLLCGCYVWQLCCWACSLIRAYGMERSSAYLAIFLITAICTLGIGQQYTTGDHSYKSEIEVGYYLGWRGTRTSNNQKMYPKIIVILPQPHIIVSH